MKNITDYEISKKSKEDIEAIKNDMKDIASRVGNLKDEALSMLYEDSSELMSNISQLKDKISRKGSDTLSNMCSYVEKDPLKSSLGIFLAGAVLAMLFLRK